MLLVLSRSGVYIAKVFATASSGGSASAEGSILSGPGDLRSAILLELILGVD